MKHLNVELQNLTTGKGYSPSIQSGDGSIDMKGWDGVAVGPTHDIVISGNGVQVVETSLYNPWSGDEFDGTNGSVVDAYAWYSSGNITIQDGKAQFYSVGTANCLLTSKWHLIDDFDVEFSNLSQSNSETNWSWIIQMYSVDSGALVGTFTFSEYSANTYEASDWYLALGHARYAGTYMLGPVRWVRTGDNLDIYIGGSYRGSVTNFGSERIRFRCLLDGKSTSGLINAKLDYVRVNSGVVGGI